MVAPRYTLLAVLGPIVFLASHPTASHGGRTLLTAPHGLATNTEFVRKACSSTTYPELCFSSLSSYASAIKNSPMLLAHTALSIALDGTRSASVAMGAISASNGHMRPREATALSDCMENVGDSIDELRESLGEMGKLSHGEKDTEFRINSIQTWVSAALTEDDTCMDSFGVSAMDGGVKAAVKGRVANVARLTSNALALVSAITSVQSSAP
ncbi:hypothetical protein HPP92_022303 [Vanilla planifolia]|uniref:Pectinesterase inhibitor domain-containing protein n=1 Tax=Vanilla planifolia TaxID=51239 RepID=A0A835PNB7_VANPL|nr:hypothetical protein HPP92_022303 [Vanilla planifolia]